ncbi:hypothetical protein [Sporolactobacillus terrae]|uniref:hypothetical protein n=1 Tax=Sporolactobacillus terrae TaxID=269673 RepID=UPI001561EBB6|nr:hypothetical protein [Sporolactobacillus terrae]
MRRKRKRPTILVVGASHSDGALPFAGVQIANRAHRNRRKAAVVSSCTQGTARVFFLHSSGETLGEEELSIVKRSIMRSSVILLLQHAAVGVALQAAAIAKTHNVNVMIDPDPMLALPEKIKRAADQLLQAKQQRRATVKKWKKRRIK